MNKQGPSGIEWCDYRRGNSRIRSGPYYLIYAPNHPHAKSKGHIYEHRYIKEKELGRFLETGEHVHHIDGDGTNNDPANLQLITPGLHASNHFLANPGISAEGTRALNEYAARIKKPRTEISCACGCGKRLSGVDKKGRNRKFIQGHNQRGRSWGWHAKKQD